MKRLVFVEMIAVVLALLLPAVAADRTWTGTVSNDWNTNGNWAEASPPSNGDNALFISGANDCAGYDASAVTLSSLVVGSGYTGNVGSSAANPLKVGADTVIIRGGATLYLGSGTTADWDEVTIDSAVSSQTITLVGANTSGFIGDMVLIDGHVVLDSGIVDTLYMEPATGDTPTITINTATVTNYYQKSAALTVSGAGAVVNSRIIGGTVTADAGTFTTIEQWGGTIVWNSTSTLSTVHAHGGTFDLSQDYRAKTITTFHAHGAATVNLSSGLNNVSFTNDLKSFGTPTFLTAPLREVEFK